MKDLILITSYHPNNKKEDILRKLINNLYNFKENFDLAIVSHTPIPLDIQNKVNISLYDSKNELLTREDLINKPWFAPNNLSKITSGYLTGRNTHLAIWRMFILGFSLAKNMGYKKIHTIEYDTIIQNIDELIDNSKLLDTYNSIYYLENENNTDPILFGSIQSYNVDHIHPTLLNLDEDHIKNMISKSNTKSPEGMLKDLIHEIGNYFVKDRNNLETEFNKFAISNKIEHFNPWGVPFFNNSTNEIKFICWNTTKIEGINNQIIVNNNTIHNLENTKYNCWQIITLGKIEEIENITIIEDGEIRLKICLESEDDKAIFKNMSFCK